MSVDKRIVELKAEVSRLRVQLSTVQLATEGLILCEKDDYGWSPAFEEARHLRARYERVYTTLDVTLPHIHGLIRLLDE